MGRLVYSHLASLDGYITDERRNFDWAAPDDEVHAFVNERMRGIGTHVYGRRLYETMRAWQDFDLAALPAVMVDFAHLWRGADKVVVSRTLEAPTTPRTTLWRELDLEALRRLVAASDGDVAIGGPTLAADALRAGLVDEVSLYVVPVIVGGGTRALPDGLFLQLELVDEHRFPGGTVYVSYRRR